MPFRAIRHFRNLLKDKENSSEVYYLIESLNGRERLREFRRFLKRNADNEWISKKRFLPDLLDNHNALSTTPQSSVGQYYIRFKTDENLTAEELVRSFENIADDFPVYDDVLQWYTERCRDIHDLMHILTDYGRDALGEACVLSFSFGQNRGRGALFLSILTGFVVKQHSPSGAPVFSAIYEALMNGFRASKLVDQDISELLNEPIAAAKSRMNIGQPRHYLRVHKICCDMGVDPYSIAT